MKRQYILLFFILIAIIQTVGAEIIEETESSTQEDSVSIKLVDIFVGESKEDSGCIFDVNGETVVVDRRDTKTVNGMTIYVQEVYAVNTEAKDKDTCAFLYYVVGESKKNKTKELVVDETMEVNTITIGNEIVDFVLTSRENSTALWKENEEGENVTFVDESIPEQTVVKVNGVEVVQQENRQEVNEKQREETKDKTPMEKKEGFFARIFSWLFDE